MDVIVKSEAGGKLRIPNIFPGRFSVNGKLMDEEILFEKTIAASGEIRLDFRRPVNQ
jgi:hypothetical protein